MSEMELTDAELARLEWLATPYANAPEWEIEDTQNICTRAVPSLVTEVQRLREKLAPLSAASEGLENDGFMASAFCDSPAPAYSQKWWEAVALNAARLAQENAALRERVEALDKMVDWLASALAWGAGKDKKPIFDRLPWCDSREKWKEAAREAIR